MITPRVGSGGGGLCLSISVRWGKRRGWDVDTIVVLVLYFYRTGVRALLFLGPWAFRLARTSRRIDSFSLSFLPFCWIPSRSRFSRLCCCSRPLVSRSNRPLLHRARHRFWHLALFFSRVTGRSSTTNNVNALKSLNFSTTP